METRRGHSRPCLAAACDGCSAPCHCRAQASARLGVITHAPVMTVPRHSFVQAPPHVCRRRSLPEMSCVTPIGRAESVVPAVVARYMRRCARRIHRLGLFRLDRCPRRRSFPPAASPAHILFAHFLRFPCACRPKSVARCLLPVSAWRSASRRLEWRILLPAATPHTPACLAARRLRHALRTYLRRSEEAVLGALKRRQQIAALNRREQLSTNPFYEECRIVLPSPLPHVHQGWARPLPHRHRDWARKAFCDEYCMVPPRRSKPRAIYI